MLEWVRGLDTLIQCYSDFICQLTFNWAVLVYQEVLIKLLEIYSKAMIQTSQCHLFVFEDNSDFTYIVSFNGHSSCMMSNITFSVET